MAYNSNPAPQTYDSTFGGIPGAVDLPNPFNDLSSVYPNLGATNQAASSDILAQLQGQLSPGTINMLQDQGAAWGIASGMPGSGLAMNRTARNLGLTAEGQVQRGLQNYSSVVPTISGTQTVSPALQTSIAERNATMRSAPNPANAQSFAKNLFDQYLQSMKGPGGGTRGSTTSPAGGSGSTPGMPTDSGWPWNPPTTDDLSYMGFGDGATDWMEPSPSYNDAAYYTDMSGGGYDNYYNPEW